MDRKKLFSFLVPVYNVEQYLHQCLNSLVKQGIDNYEIVLVDDGSTDNSGNICEEYKRKYPDLINVIHKKNEGLLLARRTAINNACGEYYIFIDSDDFVETRMLEQFAKIIAEYEPDLIVYHLDRFDGKDYSKFRDTLYENNRLIKENEKAEYYQATLLHSISNGMCGKVVKNSIVDAENDYLAFKHVSVGEDLLQSLPIITRAKIIYFSNEVLYHYRINPDSVGRVFNFGRYDSMRSVEIELEKYASKWDVKNKKNLIARHALVETVWGTLRTLSKTLGNLRTGEARKLIERMAHDKYMVNHFNSIDIKELNYLQTIVLTSLYKEQYIKLSIILNLIRLIKH